MKRLQYSLLAAAGVLLLALVLTAIGPKRVMAALGFTPVRDVDGPAMQPVQFVLAPGVESFQVPAGKRLVIDQISGEVNITPANVVVDVSIRTVVNGISLPHTIPVRFGA